MCAFRFASLLLLCLTLLANNTLACPASQDCSAPALFISRSNLELVKQRIQNKLEPYSSSANSLSSSANTLLRSSPKVFRMENISDIDFGWCSSAGGADDSLKDLTEKLLIDSDRARTLALAYLFTADNRYAEKAAEYLLEWAKNSTLLNMHSLNIEFSKASFDGMESGFCNKSWNMALDSMWQSYGLINFSDSYLILTRNDYPLSNADQTLLRNWLKNDLLPAVNTGFHAWTKWADAHPTSSAYTRYRSDNHLSWALAGLAAAAAALEDETLWQYVYRGGAYDDGSGSYVNPSNLESQLDRAIYQSGQVYDEQVRAAEHKGLFYAHFNLWALSLMAQIAETHRGENLWTQENKQGASIATAFDYYARYGSGSVSPPDTEETTDPTFFRFLYEMLVGNEWLSASRTSLYSSARNNGARSQNVQQSIGPVSLVTGDLSASQANPNPPSPPANVSAVEHKN